MSGLGARTHSHTSHKLAKQILETITRATWLVVTTVWVMLQVRHSRTDVRSPQSMLKSISFGQSSPKMLAMDHIFWAFVPTIASAYNAPFVRPSSPTPPAIEHTFHLTAENAMVKMLASWLSHAFGRSWLLVLRNQVGSACSMFSRETMPPNSLFFTCAHNPRSRARNNVDRTHFTRP